MGSALVVVAVAVVARRVAKVVDFQLVAVEVQHVAVSVDPTRTAAETVVVAAHLVETKTDSRVIAVETVVAGSRMVAVVEPLVGCPYALLSFFIQNLAIQANCCHTYRFINYQKKAEGKKGRTGYDVVELRLCFLIVVMVSSLIYIPAFSGPIFFTQVALQNFPRTTFGQGLPHELYTPW